MYIPTHFREERHAVLLDTIRAIGFGTLVTAADGTLHATHAPVAVNEADGALVLEAHLARQNDHARALDAALPSLAIFQGPQAYVSPSGYESKRVHGKVVPTWNYVAVHAHGTLERVDDPHWLMDHLHRITDANEASRPAPWSVDDAPQTFVTKLTRAIVGVRLTVTKLEGQWKMSQNKSDGDRVGTMDGLAASPRGEDRTVAGIMAQMEGRRAEAGR